MKHLYPQRLRLKRRNKRSADYSHFAYPAVCSVLGRPAERSRRSLWSKNETAVRSILCRRTHERRRSCAVLQPFRKSKRLSVRLGQGPDDQETNYDNRHDMRRFDGAVGCASRAVRLRLLASEAGQAAPLDKVHPEAWGYSDALSEAEIDRFWRASSAIGWRLRFFKIAVHARSRS